MQTRYIPSYYLHHYIANRLTTVPNIRAVMLDTQGPEIRTGSFDGAKEVDIVKGQAITLTTDSNTRSSQTPSKVR